ncbi:MAG: serine/threonine-protein kinase, partial [Chloroflexota bacterium]
MSKTTKILNNQFQVDFDNPNSFIGQGGMGAVYLGRETTTNTPVAIKVLKGDFVEHDPEMIKRFEREGDTLRQLNHPNIVKMLGAENRADAHCLVMEYVSGGSLRDLLDQQKKLSLQRSLYIALDLADALTRAHRLEILHRDIKPGNVLIAEDGTPRLTDFGMARVGGTPNITQDGAIVGTMAYLSPEAFQGDDVDERADIWAYGVMLWEMLIGERPFPQEQPAPLIQAIVSQPLPDLEKLAPELPTALVDLIYRMLDKNPASRIPSARLIGAELEAIIRGDTSTLQPVHRL